MNILITGAGGLLGNKIAEITHSKHDIYTGYNKHLSDYGEPLKLDITNIKDVQEAFNTSNPDAVLHCAALTNVDLCEREPLLAQHVNVYGTRNIVENAERHNSFLVYVSTDYVFDGLKGNYSESDPPSPINTYGKTKFEAEKIVADSKLDYCISRASVVYGAKSATGKENFVLWVIKNLESDRPINIVTDQIISPTYNHNLAEMILEVVKKSYRGVYHLAGATQIDRYSFVQEIAKEFNLEQSLVNPVKSSELNWLANRPLNSTLNIDKAITTLNTKPMQLTEALKALHRELGDIE